MKSFEIPDNPEIVLEKDNPFRGMYGGKYYFIAGKCVRMPSKQELQNSISQNNGALSKIEHEEKQFLIKFSKETIEKVKGEISERTKRDQNTLDNYESIVTDLEKQLAE